MKRRRLWNQGPGRGWVGDRDAEAVVPGLAQGLPVHPGGEREDILQARRVPREASSQKGQWESGHIPGVRKDRKVRIHRKST